MYFSDYYGDIMVVMTEVGSYGLNSCLIKIKVEKQGNVSQRTMQAKV